MNSYKEMFLNWYLLSFFAAFTLAMNIALGGAVYLDMLNPKVLIIPCIFTVVLGIMVINTAIKTYITSAKYYNKEKDSALYQAGDNDYNLKENSKSVWITVNNVSVHILSDYDRIRVKLYPCEHEMEDPLAECSIDYQTVNEELL